MLRRFGYDNTLRLKPDFVAPALAVGPDSSTELSAAAETFLRALFRAYASSAPGATFDSAHLSRYTRGHDAAVAAAVVQAAAHGPGAAAAAAAESAAGSAAAAGATATAASLFPAVDAGDLPLGVFLNAWRLLALEEPRRCMAALAYLGYCPYPAQPGDDALTVADAIHGAGLG